MITCKRLYHNLSIIKYYTDRPVNILNIGKLVIRVTALHWRPLMDIFESENMMTVRMELPGIEPSDLDVTVYENALLIMGKRQLGQSEKLVTYHMVEIWQGPFSVELLFPIKINVEKAELQYLNGLLIITLMKE